MLKQRARRHAATDAESLELLKQIAGEPSAVNDAGIQVQRRRIVEIVRDGDGKTVSSIERLDEVITQHHLINWRTN